MLLGPALNLIVNIVDDTVYLVEVDWSGGEGGESACTVEVGGEEAAFGVNTEENGLGVQGPGTRSGTAEEGWQVERHSRECGDEASEVCAFPLGQGGRVSDGGEIRGREASRWVWIVIPFYVEVGSELIVPLQGERLETFDPHEEAVLEVGSKVGKAGEVGWM